MELKDIKKVLIVGGGTMGQQIAFQCAAHGYRVCLYDIDGGAQGHGPAQRIGSRGSGPEGESFCPIQ